MSELINIKFKKFSDKAVIPTKAHPTDAGFDMVAVSKEETDQYISYKTDIALELPEGYCALLFPRSSVSKYDLSLCNSIGLIDQGFHGNIEFRYRKILNPSNLTVRKKYDFVGFFQKLFGLKDTISDIELDYNLNTYQISDKVGQLVIIPYPEITFTEVQELNESDRGEGGFGSTDKPKKPRKIRKKSSNK